MHPAERVRGCAAQGDEGTPGLRVGVDGRGGRCRLGRGESGGGEIAICGRAGAAG
mgnify:CR=1 FL=1